MSRANLLSRSGVGADRVVLAVAGLAGVALGAGYLLDRAGVVDVRANLVLRPAALAADEPWWPWAVGVAAVVLLLLGLRWAVAHVPVGRQGPVALRGGDSSGRLRADLGSVADAAADRLSGAWGVASASGRCVAERGRPTVVLAVSMSPQASPAALQPALDAVLAELAAVAGEDVPVRVEVTVARSARRGNVTRVA